MNQKEVLFVGRLKSNRRFETVSIDKLPEFERDLDKLTLLSSQTGHLFNGNKVDKENIYRIIIAERKEKIDTTPPKNKGKERKRIPLFLLPTTWNYPLKKLHRYTSNGGISKYSSVL
ncbi:hypothetical protein [Marinilabilia sp.]